MEHRWRPNERSIRGSRSVRLSTTFMDCILVTDSYCHLKCITAAYNTGETTPKLGVVNARRAELPCPAQSGSFLPAFGPLPCCLVPIFGKVCYDPQGLTLLVLHQLPPLLLPVCYLTLLFLRE